MSRSRGSCRASSTRGAQSQLPRIADSAHFLTPLAAHPLPAPPTAYSNYLNLAQLAFRVCVHSFLHSEITDKEEKCIVAVSKKHIATHVRATVRLAELQASAVRKEREGLEAQLKG